tara:strand:+ start:130 stop:936 length:807 start_codon:yes stop_codon:yes gene_type:complete
MFDFYLDASIHVALAVFFLVHATAVVLNVRVEEHIAFFLLFGSISCYNFIKYGVEAEKYIKVASKYHKFIQVFSFGCLVLAGYHAYFLNLDTFIGIGILLFLTGLYALPVLPGAKNLRSLGGLKIFLVAIIWAGATVILPVLAVGDTLSWDVWIECLQRFMFILIIIIPFEVRDLAYDKPDLRTLPQRFGVANTKSFGAFLTLPFFFMTFLKDSIGAQELIGKGILFLILGILMFVTKRKQSLYFASFWVEGIPILWYGILWGLQHFI